MTESLPIISTEPGKKAGEITIARFRREYEAADEFARNVSNFRSDVAIPAHNELRYAGYHFLAAVPDSGQEIDTEQLQKAINHCQRSMYEAADAGILSALDMIALFRDDYKLVSITDVVPDYLKILAAAREGQKLSAEKRRHQKDTPILHKDYAQLFETLKLYCYTLEIAREELNKKIREEKQKSRRWVGGLVVTIALGVAAIVVTVIVQ